MKGKLQLVNKIGAQLKDMLNQAMKGLTISLMVILVSAFLFLPSPLLQAQTKPPVSVPTNVQTRQTPPLRWKPFSLKTSPPTAAYMRALGIVPKW